MFVNVCDWLIVQVGVVLRGTWTVVGFDLHFDNLCWKSSNCCTGCRNISLKTHCTVLLRTTPTKTINQPQALKKVYGKMLRLT